MLWERRQSIDNYQNTVEADANETLYVVKHNDRLIFACVLDVAGVDGDVGLSKWLSKTGVSSPLPTSVAQQHFATLRELDQPDIKPIWLKTSHQYAVWGRVTRAAA